MVVDPLFYVEQIVFFVAGAIFTMVFLHAWLTEREFEQTIIIYHKILPSIVDDNCCEHTLTRLFPASEATCDGEGAPNNKRACKCLRRDKPMSARGVVARCLCFSAALFTIYFLDPDGALGIYSVSVSYSLLYITTVVVILSVAAGVYMYISVIYGRNLAVKAPREIKYLFLGCNSLLSVAEIVLAVIGAARDDISFLGLVSEILFPIQELAVFVLWNWALFKLVLIVNRKRIRGSKTKERNAIATRKIWYLRLASCVVTPVAVLYQIGVYDSSWGWLVSYGQPLPRRLEFSFLRCLAPLSMIAVYGFMLYAISKPKLPDMASSSDHEAEKADAEAAHAPSPMPPATRTDEQPNCNDHQ